MGGRGGPVVVRARVEGFCSGVKRAMAIVDETLKTGAPGLVLTLGEIVHNRDVVEALLVRGVRAAHAEEAKKGDTVIVRTHGAPQRIIDDLKARGVRVVDATCPKVRRSEELVRRYSGDGYFVIIAGEREHAEVTALASRAAAYAVVENRGEAAVVEFAEPVLLIGQTTFGSDAFEAIVKELSLRSNRLAVERTLCPATDARRSALLDLSRRVNALVVVGGLNSANTRRLYELALSTGLPSWHVENDRELAEEMAGYEVIGLTAGASTPPEVVDAVELALERKACGDA